MLTKHSHISDVIVVSDRERRWHFLNAYYTKGLPVGESKPLSCSTECSYDWTLYTIFRQNLIEKECQIKRICRAKVYTLVELNWIKKCIQIYFVSGWSSTIGPDTRRKVLLSGPQRPSTPTQTIVPTTNVILPAWAFNASGPQRPSQSHTGFLLIPMAIVLIWLFITFSQQRPLKPTQTLILLSPSKIMPTRASNTSASIRFCFWDQKQRFVTIVTFLFPSLFELPIKVDHSP